VSPRALHSRFNEAVGEISGVDWLFGLDEADPWVKTQAFILSTHRVFNFSCSSSQLASKFQRCTVSQDEIRQSFFLSDFPQVFHASYILQVASQRVEQALVPMANFVLGGPGLEKQPFSPINLPALCGRLPVRSSSPAKVPSQTAPLKYRELSGQVSPLRSPIHSIRVSKSPCMRRPVLSNALSIALAQQSTLVDSLVLHETSEKQKQDTTLTPVPHSQIPLVPTHVAPVSPHQDCPRIDLLALVREKRKTKKPQGNKLPMLLLREEQHHCLDPRIPGSESFR
jgi:hypothetical protein